VHLQVRDAAHAPALMSSSAARAPHRASGEPSAKAGKKSTARPARGVTATSRRSKRVTPPAATSFRYTSSVAARWKPLRAASSGGKPSCGAASAGTRFPWCFPMGDSWLSRYTGSTCLCPYSHPRPHQPARLTYNTQELSSGPVMALALQCAEHTSALLHQGNPTRIDVNNTF